MSRFVAVPSGGGAAGGSRGQALALGEYAPEIRLAGGVAKLGSTASRFAALAFPEAGAAADVLGGVGSVADIGGAIVSNQPDASKALSVTRGATQLAGAASRFQPLADNVPGLSQFGDYAGPIGSLLGLGLSASEGNTDAVVRGASGLLTNPSTYTSIAKIVGPEVFGGALEAGGTAAAAGAGVAGAETAAMAGAGTASLAALPVAIGGIAASIDQMISKNTRAKAMARNVGRANESAGLMSTFSQALQGGNLEAEVVPGVRAGDLLASLAAAADRGELAADAEGIMPTGRYESLAQQLRGQGFRDVGWAGLNGLPGITHANTLGEFVGGLDERAQPDRIEGPAFGQWQEILDAMSEGLPAAFDADEALRRSSLFSSHNVGRREAPALGQFRNDVMANEADPSLTAQSSPRDVLLRYVNDPESWRMGDVYRDPTGAEDWRGISGTNLGMAVRAAEQMGAPVNFEALRRQIEERTRAAQQAQAARAIGPSDGP